MFTPPSRDVSKVFIHCSASDNPDHDSVDVIRGWHLARGWRDIGYHYVITKDGEVHKGRPLAHEPAAQKGHNVGSVAICVTGLAEFTARQMRALLSLCIDIDKRIDVTFHGHCEVNPNKTCPVFDYKAVLRLDKNGNMRR